MSSQQLKYVRVAIAALALIFLLVTSSLMMGQVAPNLPYRFMPLETLKPSTSTFKPSGEAQEVRKTKGFKLIAMVFYGRRQYVEILDCYLKRNLAENGGLIDEVHFMANTARRGDLEYLDYLLTTSKSYVKIKPRKLNLFDEMWAHATDKDSMYIKIDDDIVYIHDDAIPRLVNTLIQHPEAHLASANLINSALSNWQHFHTDAILPYLPEPTSPMKSPHSKNLTSWRASELPAYPTVPDSPWYFPEVPFGGLDIGVPGGPPFQGHRWLPLPPDAKNLLKTPIFGAVYDAEMGIHHQWAIAAQEHYSFLENLENNQLTKYWTGNREGIWNLQYQRHNLNFVAIWGSSVANDLPGLQDEIDLFVTIPKRIGKPAIIDTHAIVSHFSFWPQARELLTTDLLERYKMYAEETGCKKI